MIFPKVRAAVFVHGCFWHGHGCSRAKLPQTNVEFWKEKIGKNRIRDRKARARLRKLGWQVITLWQCELRNMDAAVECLSVVKKRLTASRKAKHPPRRRSEA
jgi:DNA mismatch endonuclease (patch repair protein)